MTRCCVIVKSRSTYQSHQCKRNGVVEDRENFYCRQHAPETNQARQAKRADKVRSESDARRIQHFKASMFDELLSSLEKIQDECSNLPGAHWDLEHAIDLSKHVTAKARKGLTP